MVCNEEIAVEFDHLNLFVVVLSAGNLRTPAAVFELTSSLEYIKEDVLNALMLMLSISLFGVWSI